MNINETMNFFIEKKEIFDAEKFNIFLDNFILEMDNETKIAIEELFETYRRFLEEYNIKEVEDIEDYKDKFKDKLIYIINNKSEIEKFCNNVNNFI